MESFTKTIVAIFRGRRRAHDKIVECCWAKVSWPCVWGVGGVVCPEAVGGSSKILALISASPLTLLSQ